MTHEPQPPAPTTPSLEQFMRRLFDATPDLVTVVDDEGRFLHVNAHAVSFFGKSASQLRGRDAFSFVHEADRAETRAAFEQWLRAAPEPTITWENRQVGADGSARLFRWTIFRHVGADDSTYVTSYARDVTDMRDAVQKLQENEVRLRAVLSGMLEGVVTIDTYGVVQDASDSIEVLFGYPPGELVGQNIKVLMPDPHRQQHDDYLARYRASGETWILNSIREFEVVHKNGTPFWCEISVSRVDVPGQPAPIFCGVFRDVTARKRAERELAEKERRFRVMFDQEYQLGLLLSPAGEVVEVNQAALEMSGLPKDDILGTPLWALNWWSPTPGLSARIREWFEAVSEGGLVRSEVLLVDSRGEARTLDFSLKAVRGVHEELLHVLAEGRDISLLKEAQRKELGLHRALAAMGESAAMLAHEIKNPITSVNVALRAVARQLGENERVVLEDLVRRMQKLERTLRRTLSFARPLELELAPTSVEELLEEACAQLEPEARACDVAFEIDVEPGCPPVMADAGHVEEVIVNIVRNALDALEGDGHVRLAAARDGDRVRITIDDDGPGLPNSVRTTLFRPFTTTKPDGTGVGLALARKVAEEHDGTLDAGDSPLGGARFTLRLPAARGAQP
jgi:two-component system sensor kinase FixL